MQRALGAILLLAMPAAVCAQDAKEPTLIPGIGPVGKVEEIVALPKGAFTEGPASDGKGNIYFSDIPNNKIYKIDAKNKNALTVVIDKSNAANGLMFGAKGELFACEMDGQIVAYNLSGDKPQRRVVAATYEGKRFNAPNDLVIDKQGGVYFTDPMFRAPTPLPQGATCVYYVSTDGKVTRIIDDLKNPNGVKLSPDGKTLYVIPTGPAEMMAYPVEAPAAGFGHKKVTKLGKVFCKLKMPEGEDAKKGGGGDGMTIDEKGNLYITSSLGIQVFDPAGKALGIITLPKQPSNCTFGGPGNNVLYVTAHTSVYTVPMEVKGHIYPAGK